MIWKLIGLRLRIWPQNIRKRLGLLRMYGCDGQNVWATIRTIDPHSGIFLVLLENLRSHYPSGWKAGPAFLSA
jgi:hypothetical protein